MNRLTTERLNALRRIVINEVIDIEGGFVDDPKDSGGATKCGITQATATKHGFPNVRKLTKDQIYQIYQVDYWDDICGDELAHRSERLAYRLFDIAVNMGDGRASEFLQRSLNVLNNNGNLYPDIEVDNDIGPNTLEALDGFIRHRGQRGLETLVDAVKSWQGWFYMDLSERRSKDERFTQGWLNRLGNDLPTDKEHKTIPTPPPGRIVYDNQPPDNTRTQEITMNPELQSLPLPPPDGFVTTVNGEDIPYYQHQVDAFERNPNTGFASWLKDQAELARKASSKSGWKSKLMWAGGRLIAYPAVGLLARFGFDIEADTLLGVGAVVMAGEGSFVMIARKYFTKKFLF